MLRKIIVLILSGPLDLYEERDSRREWTSSGVVDKFERVKGETDWIGGNENWERVPENVLQNKSLNINKEKRFS